MPLTPFHLGPAVLLGSLATRRLDLPALCLGSVVIDVRAVLVIFGPLDPPTHGPLTTLLGGAFVAVAVAVAVLAGYEMAGPTIERYGLDLRWSRSSVAAGALVGVWSHVVLDAMLYTETEVPNPSLSWQSARRKSHRTLTHGSLRSRLAARGSLRSPLAIVETLTSFASGYARDGIRTRCQTSLCSVCRDSNRPP